MAVQTSKQNAPPYHERDRQHHRRHRIVWQTELTFICI